jgi:hypothetical protein
MNKKLITYSIYILAGLAVLYPVWVCVSNMPWAWDATLPGTIFPVFGLAAFALLWLHIVGPALRPWLDQFVNFEKFLRKTSPFILAFMLLHPLLLLTSFGFRFPEIFTAYEADDVVLGMVGLIFLLTFDIGEMLRKREFVVRHWNKILLISSIGFVLIFFHSLALGDDLQAGFLRYLWMFYGATGILAIAYNYFGRKLFHQAL